MVKQVAHKSEAETAGLKAFDVILKVGSDPISTVADWDRSLRANQGKPVQVTVLRDRKQQTLTLLVDSKHHGMIEFDGVFADDDCPLLMAELDEDLAQGVAAEALRAQADELRKSIGSVDLKIDKKQMDALKQQVEQLRQNFKMYDFKIDQKQMDELREQMKELQKTLPDQLNKELEELNKMDVPGVADRA
jgi:membrane-associated protease RseP (regulator of RpoE activity)